MVRRQEVRAVLLPELLEAGHADPVEQVDERVDQEHLDPETERSDQGRERPAPGPDDALRVASGLDEGDQLADGRIRLEQIVVDEDARLLLDDPEQLDPLERVEIEIGRQPSRRLNGRGLHVREAGDDDRDRIDVVVERIAPEL